MKPYLRHLVLCVVVCLPTILHAQLFVDNAVNATDGVQNVLLGTGVTASNITFSGNDAQIGSFTCTGCNLGIANGLVMGSGSIDGAPGPNSSGSSGVGPTSGWGATDPDLAQLSGFSLNDAAVLEFDFIPTGDSLVFEYVFGSDEYPEFANSSFNDAFGFFLSGPGISGPYSNSAANIALIPGTTLPVTINNLNNGSTGTNGPCEYCQYYIHNGNGGGSDPLAIECDGFTTVLTAYASVQCGETYHIKLAIADAGDTGYDSYVFLAAGSFSSNQVQLSYTPPTISPDQNSVYEGCQPAILEFERPANQSGEATYEVVVTGTATNGVDYTYIADSLYFAAGQLSVELEVDAFLDDLTEGPENITITVMGLSICSTSEDSVTFTFNLQDIPELEVSIPDVLINCGETALLEPQITGGFGFYEILWDSGETTSSISVSPDIATSYPFTVTDTCSVTPYTGLANVVFPNYPPITVDIGPDQILSCLDPIEATSLVNGGYGAYTYEWEVNSDFISDQTSLSYVTDDAGNVTLTITDECGETGQDEFDFSFPAVPVLVDLGPDMDVTCLDITTLSSQVSGGVGTYTYSWTSPEFNLGTDPTADVQVDDDLVITLTVEDQCENVGTDNITLFVPPVPINLELGADLTVTCIDESLIEPQISGGVGNYSYSWSTQGGVESLDATFLFQTSNTTTLALEVEDECGNSASDAITVAVPEVAVQLDLGTDLTVGCVDITPMNPTVGGGVGIFEYTWMINGSVVSLDEDFNLQVTDDATLSLLVEDQCGNSASDDIEVTVPPVPVIVDLGPDITTTCIDENLLVSQVSGGVGSYSYNWLYQGLNIGLEPTQTFQTYSNATVVLEVQDECGNSNSDQINILVPPVPILSSMNMPDTAICIGNGVDLEVFATGGVGEYSYTWSPDPGETPYLYDLPMESTTYTVTITDECGNSDQTSVFVGVEDVFPAFTVDYIGNWDVQLNNLSDDGVSYLWYFGDGTTSEDFSPYHTFNTLEPWQVTLVVTGELGCSKSVTEIFYPLADLYIPNCFTPDGDGVNEVFQVFGHDILHFEITVFNRWGDIVYTSTDINEAWTGGQRGGEHFVPDGVYSYFVKAEGIRGNFIEKTGHITVVR